MDGMTDVGMPPTDRAARAALQVGGRFVESENLDQIWPALCKLQRSIHNPRRNKTAKVKGQTPNGKDFEYTYKYADAGSINDMLREPMGDCDLLIISFPVRSKEFGSEQFTRVVHALSGQWIGCYWPLEQAAGKKATQDFAGFTTYARRYSVNCLLNIATGEDDDANVASGQPVSISNSRAADDLGRDVYLQLLTRARQAKRPADAIPLLALWQDEMQGFAAWRHAETEDQKGAFALLSHELKMAVKRCCGEQLGVVFGTMMAARTHQDVERLRESFQQPAVVAETAALKKTNPKAYSLLQEHMRYFASLAVEQEPDPAVEEEVRAVEGAFVCEKPAEPPAMAATTVARTDDDMDAENRAALEALVSQVETGDPPLPGLQAPTFCHHVRDETGDLITDEMTDPVEWARMYGDTWANASNLTAVATANKVALDALTDFPDAMAALEEAMAKSGEWSAEPGIKPPQVVPFEWPKNRAGTGIDCAQAVKLIERQLTMLESDAHMSAWLDANAGGLRDTAVPQATRLRIDRLIMERRSALRRD